MKEKIKQLQDLLLNKRIKHKTAIGFKYYTVKTIVERNSRIVIETIELKTFTETLDTIDALLSMIEILDNSESIVNKPLESVSASISANKSPGIVSDNAKNISDGLMSIFNQLTTENNFSDSQLKKMKLTCDVAGKLIDIEKVKLGYLNLSTK